MSTSGGPGPGVRDQLAGGPARGLGCAPQMAKAALHDAALLHGLVHAAEDDRAVVAARAANALKKVQQANPRALDPFVARLLKAALACTTPEARWNLWLVLGKARLTDPQRAMAAAALTEALASHSALERVHAVQALADLSAADPSLRLHVQALVQGALQDGSAAVRARARKLLLQPGGAHTPPSQPNDRTAKTHR